MSAQELTLEASEFIATCRALKAASAGSRRFVELRFEPSSLTIEGEMGGGVVRTTGDFRAHLKVPSGLLAKVASLHRTSAKTHPWIKCTLDNELGEIRFPLGGLKARFQR
jgi:hypothetical protein